MLTLSLQTTRRWTDLGDGKGVAPTAAVPNSHADSITQANEDADGSSSDYDSDSSVSSASSTSSDSGGKAVGSEPTGRTAPPQHQSSNEASKAASPKEGEDEKQKEKKKDKGDTWIYVSDANYQLYIGIKQKGRFQHSSFLAGGPITSAGTLIIEDGKLVKISPMSGHYRTKAVYFKRFVDELQSEGADLSGVKIGKTEMKLWFIERANTLHSLVSLVHLEAIGACLTDENHLFVEGQDPSIKERSHKEAAHMRQSANVA